MTSTRPLTPALALTVLSCLSGAASAQSSLTIGGVIDLAARSVHNSNGTLKSMTSGANSTSRLIIRGNEDLGGGMLASFWLEGSMTADTGVTGSGGQFWDRQSTVSISGRFGEVRAGRDWTPVYTGFVFGDPWVNVGVGSGSNFLNASASTTYQRAFGSALNPTTLSRSSNAVEYWLPADLGGVYGNVMLAPGEGGNAAGSFRYRGGRVGYKSGGLDVATYAGATHIDAAGRDLTQGGLFAAYRWPSGVSLMASATQSRFAESRQWHWMGGVRAPVGQWTLKASYNRLDQQGRDGTGLSIDANDAAQWALGADYALSKRTALYGTVARLSNRGTGRFAVPGGVGSAAAGSASSGVDLGVRHSF